MKWVNLKGQIIIIIFWEGEGVDFFIVPTRFPMCSLTYSQ
jgi:hypothetical protein